MPWCYTTIPCRSRVIRRRRYRRINVRANWCFVVEIFFHYNVLKLTKTAHCNYFSNLKISISVFIFWELIQSDEILLFTFVLRSNFDARLFMIHSLDFFSQVVCWSVRPSVRLLITFITWSCDGITLLLYISWLG